MSNHNNKQRDRLKALLKELFQLDKPELDFGLYKIMHAKSQQITQFLDKDLLKEIEAAFGAESAGRVQHAELKVAEAIEQAKSFGAADPEATPPVMQARAAYKLALEGGNTEAEIYDHLYRFFERYYDNGDFLSKRYYARENDSRAAPYSVPYDGREVYLHWANKDQYYIKSGEYLNNFSFDLTEAVRLNLQTQAQPVQGFDFGDAKAKDGPPLKVHMHLAQAQEGEHGNIKAAADQKREFIPLLSNPVAFNDQGELVLNFEYRVLPEGYPIDAATEATLKNQYDFKNKGDVPAHWMVDVFLRALQTLDKDDTRYLPLLAEPVPTDTQKKRPLLAKYIQQYTARNTMDYFIHKDLGGFLRRELDFYIKNELMRLDDIENADAPRVEDYLGKIKALRRIAHQLIAFLAQLEDFQKKLWLKKKFVTETQYCITLDRVPESLYPAIAANDAQREEWVKLFAIDEIVGDTAQVGYSVPLTVEFLKANPFLLVDTGLFDEDFSVSLVNEIGALDDQCDGVLMHSDNYQALELMQVKYKKSAQCIYIDPPYNTDASAINYKNGYKSSSWISLMQDRLALSKNLMPSNGVLIAAIDDAQQRELSQLLTMTFGAELLGTICVRSNPSGRPTKSGYAVAHEYLFFVGKSEKSGIGRLPPTPEQMARFNQVDELGSFEWRNLRREGSNSDRSKRRWLFYPIYIDGKNIRVPRLSEDLKNETWIVEEAPKKSEKVVYPLNEQGDEKTWRWEWQTVMNNLSSLEVRPDRTGKDYVYVKRRPNDAGVVSVSSWFDAKYSATEHGTALLKSLFGKNPFTYPKSLHAVIDSIYIGGAVYSKSMIIDYFGGSGTTAHAVINLNKSDKGGRKYILVEQNMYFDEILRPRIQKVAYSTDWKDGKPVERDGISHCFKYLRLESYEDTLNNLSLQTDPARERALADNPALRQDYVLNYWLDVETQGSQSLLNVAAFRDPTAYTMRIKQPGSDVLREQRIDLIETFNWLIGLWVEHMAAPQTLEAEFTREVDPVLPKDQNTRLVCKRIKPAESGPYWFRLVEGYTLKVPGDDSSRQKTLVVWRKLTDDAEKDNAVLQHFLMEKLAISPREHTYAVIYVNGSHTLPNPVVEGEQTKVRLIEEAFHAAMWSQDGV